MDLPDIIGFIGVFLILFAFLLNLLNKIKHNSIAYTFTNFIGAGMACYASILLKYIPFIILEGIWTLVSLIAFFRIMYRRDKKL